jgi:hypothetical protein
LSLHQISSKRLNMTPLDYMLDIELYPGFSSSRVVLYPLTQMDLMRSSPHQEIDKSEQ